MGLEIVGSAQIAYSGIKKLNWVDADEVYYALEHVLEAVEKQAGSRIRTADIGVPGSFLKIVNKNVQMPVHGRVSYEDVDTLIEKAGNFRMDGDFEILQAYPAWFLLDDGNIYIEPFDVPTQKLRGSISFVLANKFFLDDVTKMLKHLGIKLNRFIPEPVAQALYLVPQEKRDSLAVLVDIGYYSTNVSLIYGDSILYFGTIPMGGGSITSDIEYAMKVSKETAEQLKRRYSFGMEELSSSSYIYAKDENGKLQKYPYDLMKEIIDARVEHIAAYIGKLLRKPEQSFGRKFDIYITGGGISFMGGAASFLRNVLGRTPHMVKVQNTKLHTEDMHAAYAMARYAFDGYMLDFEGPQHAKKGMRKNQE